MNLLLGKSRGAYPLADPVTGIAQTRHHVVPWETLWQAWDALIENAYNDKESEIYKMLDDFVLAWVDRLDPAHPSRLNYKQEEQANIPIIREFARLFRDPASRHDADEHPPEGLDDLRNIFTWLPRNLFAGPSNRSDDPGSKLEAGCARIIGQENLDKRTETFHHLDKYRKKPKNGDGMALDGLKGLQGLIEALSSPSPPVTWPCKDSDWARGANGKYYILPPASPSTAVVEPSSSPGHAMPSAVDSVIDIGGARLELATRSDEDGYVLRGVSATNVRMADLLDWLGQEWGVAGELPQSLRSFELQYLTIEVLSMPGNVEEWEVTAATEVSVANTVIDLLVCFRNSTPQGGSSAFSLSADAGFTTSVEGEDIRLWFSGAIARTRSGGWELSASLQDYGRALSLTHLASALGVDVPADLEPFVPSLSSASFTYRLPDGGSAAGSLVLSAVVGRVGVVVASVPGTSGAVSRLVAVRGDVRARASDLPLIGEAIPHERDVVFTDAHFAYCSGRWSKEQVQQLNTVIDGLDDGRLPRLLDQALQPGGLVWVDVAVGGEVRGPLVSHVAAGGRAVALGRGEGAYVDGGTGQTLVLGRERANGQELAGLVIGPVRIRRVGLDLRHGVLFIAFDVALTVGPLQLDMLGLGFGIDSGFNVSPALRGAGVVLDKPPVRLSGLLERRSDAEYSELLRGAVSIEARFVAVEAFGMYARSRADWSSMFLFGELGATGGRGLFGPPPFRVLSLCLGFGVNSTVRAPSVSQISQFPLVNKLGSGTSPGDALEALQSWITPKEGQYWGAGGLEFSSFEFISTRALLLVEGGQEWQVMLLGRTTLDFPRNKSSKRPLARVVIDIAIGYSQRAKVFSMDAVVAPGSYVLDPAAELTGGLAVRIWGQDAPVGRGFVFTLGGYHKDFKEPSYYPQVPRLGWRWARGNVSIRGEVYAAITDAAFMAGGRLEVRYDKGHGIRLEAWLTARVDALVQWKPFYFSLSMGISVGVAATVKVLFVRVRVSLEVGVSLDLWGPPIGGTARVKVWFISFTIGIGSSKGPVPLPGWDEFKVQLPGPLAIVSERGILADADPGELAARAAANAPLLVTIDGFAFSTTSSVPASKLMLNDAQFKPGARVNIRPMGKFGATSEHKVTIRKGGTTFHPAAEKWNVSEVIQNMPAALWGAELADAADALKDRLVPNCLTGIRFEVPPPQKTGELGPASAEALGTEHLDPTKIPLRSAAAAGPASEAAEDSVTTIANEIAASATTAKRNAAYAGLTALGVEPGSNDPLGGFADRARSWFTDAPLTTEAAT
ncbi:DUF6603 domain-containing protein [Streptomyces sp. NRRL S-1448]|uniref:DUF6603 domain-containing protein n=1 Tax=Streptomyces sp. NRRL S-1448 TaxID=1463883 RepID=UPI002D2183EF|nr:DUF6603 domain-containing protein [Streptomyces sp. NRRL S-1448]